MSSHEVPPLPTSPTQVDLFIHATTGFNRLLDNDVEGAQATFALAPNSAAHNVGIGITSFLQAALGMEDAELSSALDVLVKAEERAQAEATLQAKVKETTVYPKGLEYKVRCCYWRRLEHRAVEWSWCSCWSCCSDDCRRGPKR